MGIVADIITKLKTSSDLQYVSVWNNQMEYIENGGDYSFPLPSGFIELITDNLQDIGGGYQGSDLTANIHILHNNLTNPDDIGLNSDIFDLKNNIIKLFFKFQPTQSSIFIRVSEQQDFNHDNVYHYIITYKLHYIDNITVSDETTITNPDLTILH